MQTANGWSLSLRHSAGRGRHRWRRGQKFEKGWKRWQFAYFNSQSHLFEERWLPNANAWWTPASPGNQLRNLEFDGLDQPLTGDDASTAWTKITKAFEAVRQTYPEATYQPSYPAGWKAILYPNPKKNGEPEHKGDREKTPLELARERAQEDRRRELEYVETEYAARRMDTEEYARQVKAIEDKYSKLI